MSLPGTVARLFGLGPQVTPGEQLFAGLIGAFVIANGLLVLSAVLGPWGKRKIHAAFWDKIGPNRIGPFGILIIVADTFRFLSKELIIPDGTDRPAYDIAPLLIPFSAILGFAVLPLGSGLQLADPETGLVFLFAAASIASLGLVMGGYASNNKYSLLGALRAVAQNIAYEIPLVVTAASVVLFTGTLQLSEIVAKQAEPLVTVAGVTIPSWFAFVNPFAFALFVAANMAEVGRNPFDIPEAPTEIVAGYMTEYGSVYFILFYVGEFLHIFLGGGIIATVFLGGGTAPISTLSFIPGVIWFVLKVVSVFFLTQWMRAAVPRVRIDQLITIGWKGMLVLSFTNLLLTAVIVGLLSA